MMSTPDPAAPRPAEGGTAGGHTATLTFDLDAVALSNLALVFNGLREGATVADVIVWFLAVCHRCGEDLAQPFRDEHDRDEWAARHLADVGHTVQLTVEGLDAMPGLHMSGVLRLDDDGRFKWLCPAADCERWNGPYDTPQLAIASWRGHSPAGRA